ncbi:MAG: sigma 54-interacting transcriptional regulator [Desulfosarcinaceae bacterium]|nr:sigma 54-interacting transcriptional regulator [Desulfosarcinaceae bacterium]
MNANPVTDKAAISAQQLREISSWVASVQDLDQTLDLITESATRIVGAEAASLLLLDEKTNALFFKTAIGEKKQKVKEFRVKVGQGIAGHVAEKGEPLLIKDVRQDDRWYKEISDSLELVTRSIACVPLKLQAKVIGVMQLINKKDGTAFDEADRQQLQEFAGLAALALGSAKRFQRFKQENKFLRKELGDRHQIVGRSVALDKVLNDAIKVAKSKASALILGESGTGKELLARLIHEAGPRADQPLVILNCAALPETLLEDELFGHEKGAFTGAIGRKIGKFELAHEGTIFLDEIGEMNFGMQAKLLRVLQEGVFYRVGGNTPITVDVRVLSATNKELDKEVAEGNFREDLYYRLNVVQINLPPLRQRMEDIPVLAEHFLNLFKEETGLANLRISKEAMQKIQQYNWPGNIRELRNAIERAVVMREGETIVPDDLPIKQNKRPTEGVTVGLTLEEALNQFKRDFIIMNLKHTSGNRSQAAKIMDIQRTYLSRLISKYELRDH